MRNYLKPLLPLIILIGLGCRSTSVLSAALAADTPVASLGLASGFKTNDTILVSLSYTSAVSTKILNFQVWAVSVEKGNWIVFDSVPRTDGGASNTAFSFRASHKVLTTDPRGTWLMHSKYQNQAGTWVTDSTSTPMTLLSDSATPQPLPSPTPTPTPSPTPVPTPTPSPTPTPVPTPTPSAGDWLTTSGNKIVKSDGTVWMGRGANLFDTRGCMACAFATPNVAEVKRRVDEIAKWGGNFIRLDMESYAGTGTYTKPVTSDPAYLADIKSIVDYIGTKPGMYVELSLWIDPTFTAMGWPTAGTSSTWSLLATTFKDQPRVMFGLVNEPQSNFNGLQDAQVWTAMSYTVAAIRSAEATVGGNKHLVAVQGTRAWSRILTYYISHPIMVGNGERIIYETHVYDPSSQFNELFVVPAQTLPVIIGEFGPVDSAGMTLVDTQLLMDKAESLHVSYLAWAFHGRCPPNLLVDLSNGGCGVNMQLVPTPWGQQLKTQLGHAVP